MDLINKTNLDDLIDSNDSDDSKESLVTINRFWYKWCNCIDCEANNYYNTLIWNNSIDDKMNINGS